MCSELIYKNDKHIHIIKRKDAIKIGTKRYFTGKPCKHGHLAERHTTSGDCVECLRKRLQKRMEEDPSYYKRWRNENTEHSKEYFKNNKDRINKLRNRTERKKKKKKYQKEWNQLNSDHVNSYRRNRYKEDIEYRLSVQCRNMVSRCIKEGGEEKNSSSFELLGYSPEDLKLHIESLFLEGMSWDNMEEWHIDHIYPVSRYIKEGITDSKIINSLSNLQPMWADDNKSKNDMLFEEWAKVNPERAKLYM